MVVAKFDDASYTNQDSLDFYVDLIDHCLSPSITSPGTQNMADYYYDGSTNLIELDEFTVSPPECGPIYYTCFNNWSITMSCIEVLSFT